jgi:hypothetical protein
MSGEPFIHPLSQIHATSSRRIVADANFSRKLLHFGLTRHTAYAAWELRDALRVGSHVVAKYWEKDGSANGWWLAIITGIDKNDFIIRWPDEPKTPPLKVERKHVAILHSAYDVAHEWLRRR